MRYERNVLEAYLTQLLDQLGQEPHRILDDYNIH
jgi:hypothetical protein